MASGITHILLMKCIDDKIENTRLKNILASSIDFLQVGAIAPDLPYASILDDDYFFSTQSELADKFHYDDTNEIPLRALRMLKKRKNSFSIKTFRYMFSFYIGYISHLIADGIIHPYVRDMVGDYKENQTAHRKLEMELDVLFFNYITRFSGHPIELNYSNIHDELINFYTDFYPETKAVVESFSKLIFEVYKWDCPPEEILSWVKGLHRMFGVAEGNHPAIYKKVGFVNDFLFSNYDELIEKYDNILTLIKPKERKDNFLKKPKVHFFDDCIPQFYKKFIPVLNKSYQYVFNSGPEPTAEDISRIDLDTGRDLASNSLDNLPSYWS